MSDPSTTSDSSATKGTSAASGRTRSLLLLAVLAVLLVALAYDYQVARPRVHEAYEKITERHEEVNSTAGTFLTDQDIHELLGMEPSRTFPDGPATVEVFSWASGLPFRTHDLFVVYQKRGQRQMFLRHAKFGYDSSADLKQQSATETAGDPQEPVPAAPNEAGAAADDPAAAQPVGG